MKLAKWFSLLAMFVMVLTCSSCKTVKKQGPAMSAAVTSSSYSWGTYKATVSASLFMVDKAVRRACARARLHKTDQAYHTNTVDYKYEDIDKAAASISIATGGGEHTTIKIRIGSWGDERSSLILMVAIDEELRLLLSQPGIAEEPVQR